MEVSSATEQQIVKIERLFFSFQLHTYNSFKPKK